MQHTLARRKNEDEIDEVDASIYSGVLQVRCAVIEIVRRRHDWSRNKALVTVRRGRARRIWTGRAGDKGMEPRASALSPGRPLSFRTHRSLIFPGILWCVFRGKARMIAPYLSKEPNSF